MNFLYKVYFPILSVTILILVGILVYAIYDRNFADESANAENIIQNNLGDDDFENRIFTFADVSEANEISNCLVIYRNEVFEIPEDYADRHPGGARSIINSCGADMTTGFDSIPSHQRESTLEELRSFRVGIIR